MNDQTISARDAALAFIHSVNAGVIATAGHDNIPHATVIHFICDDSFNVYFLTKKESRKYGSIMAHPQVSFVAGRSDVPQSLQIEGVASELHDDETAQEKIDMLMGVLSTHVPGYVPLAKMDGTPTLMWIQPKTVRWNDFSKPAIGNENLMVEIPLTA